MGKSIAGIVPTVAAARTNDGALDEDSFQSRVRPLPSAGANALMLLPPFFLGPAEEPILEHLKRLIGSVGIPACVQYAPAHMGVRIAAWRASCAVWKTSSACWTSCPAR
jgi:dihydrodipicolinate synthase/N-acetylneuraminate lyase